MNDINSLNTYLWEMAIAVSSQTNLPGKLFCKHGWFNYDTILNLFQVFLNINFDKYIFHHKDIYWFINLSIF